MRIFRRIAIGIAFVLAAINAATGSDEMQAGVTVVDITPPTPFRLPAISTNGLAPVQRILCMPRL